MAIKSSGPLSMLDIVGEFGGTVPHSLGEYYRGQGLVNVGITQIPEFGNPISMSQFYGVSNLITMTYTMFGGGGGGGNGFEDGSGSGTRAVKGVESGIMTKANYERMLSDNGNAIPGTIDSSYFLAPPAPGGLGGVDGNQGSSGTAGGGTEYGIGGAGGGQQSAGGHAPWGHWGAAGGGGGGDTSDSYLFYRTDSAGAGGSGGAAGGSVTNTVSVTPGDYVVVLGRGGYWNGGIGNYRGGYGNPGSMKSLSVSSAPGQITSAIPPNPDDTSENGYAVARITTHIIPFTITTNGSVNFT